MTTEKKENKTYREISLEVARVMRESAESFFHNFENCNYQWDSECAECKEVGEVSTQEGYDYLKKNYPELAKENDWIIEMALEGNVDAD